MPEERESVLMTKESICRQKLPGYGISPSKTKKITNKLGSVDLTRLRNNNTPFGECNLEINHR